MHKNFHPVGAAIGEEISAVRFRRTEHRDHSGQRGLGTGAHIHGLGGEPDSVDADHWASSRTKRAQPSGSDVGHFTVMDCSSAGSSMIASASDGRLGEAF